MSGSEKTVVQTIIKRKIRNPVDSADYAMQLAAFSTVEQQVLLNQKMDVLQNNLHQNTLASLSNWMGKTVKLPGSFT